jgi:hypothetical protein
MDNDEINKIVKAYKKKRERELNHYQLIKDNPDFKDKNRTRAKNHYTNNKDKYKLKYETNKDMNKIKSLYRYYLKKNDIDGFKFKHPEKFKIIEEEFLSI